MLKPIPGFNGRYCADEHGNVWVMREQVDNRNRTRKRIYPYRLKKNEKRGCNWLRLGNKTRRVAPIILETFVSERPTGMFACHGPRGRFDDSVDNLYWATPLQNAHDKVRDGTQLYEMDCGTGVRRLNSLQVRIIRRMYALCKGTGIFQKHIGEIFGVGQKAISKIVLNQRWWYV